MSSKAITSSGFVVAAHFELKALNVLSRVLNGYIVAGSLRQDATEFMKLEDRMTPQLRSACKVRGRSPYNNAKLAWDKLLAIWPDGVPDADVMFQRSKKHTDQVTSINTWLAEKLDPLGLGLTEFGRQVGECADRR